MTYQPSREPGLEPRSSGPITAHGRGPVWAGGVCVIAQRPQAALCTHHLAFADTCGHMRPHRHVVTAGHGPRQRRHLCGRARHSQRQGRLQPEAALFSTSRVLPSLRQETTPMGRTDSVLRAPENV